MNCGRKCPFYWYDDYSSENHCGLSERGGKGLEKFMETDYGCWLPLWLVSAVYFIVNVYDRIDYHLWLLKERKGGRK